MMPRARFLPVMSVWVLVLYQMASLQAGLPTPFGEAVGVCLPCDVVDAALAPERADLILRSRVTTDGLGSTCSADGLGATLTTDGPSSTLRSRVSADELGSTWQINASACIGQAQQLAAATGLRAVHPAGRGHERRSLRPVRGRPSASLATAAARKVNGSPRQVEGPPLAADRVGCLDANETA